MFRWLATAIIAALFVIAVFLPSIPIARRGKDATLRAEVAGLATSPAALRPALARLELPDLDGNTVRVAELRGRPVLITFERSVDW